MNHCSDKHSYIVVIYQILRAWLFDDCKVVLLIQFSICKNNRLAYLINVRFVRFSAISALMTLWITFVYEFWTNYSITNLLKQIQLLICISMNNNKKIMSQMNANSLLVYFFSRFVFIVVLLTIMSDCLSSIHVRIAEIKFFTFELQIE